MLTDITLTEALVLIETPMYPDEDESVETLSLEKLREDVPAEVRNEVSDLLNSLIMKGYVLVHSNGEFYLSEKGTKAGLNAMKLMSLAFKR